MKPNNVKPQDRKCTKSQSRGKQGRKDSRSKRVNLDNERESKYITHEMRAAGMKDGRSNDISWYTRNGELLKSATSTNFTTTTGSKPPLNTTAAVPGIMSIRWSPVMGAEQNDPLNQSMNSTYSFLVHANSRNYKYNAPDMMVLMLAGMNVFTAIAMGVRAFGTMLKFEGQDMYTPRALVTAMGFDYADLRNNISQMWFDLNALIAQTKQIWVPNTMPILERWYWLTSNIYRDGDSVKSQYYMFVPSQLYIYNAGSVVTPGSQLQAYTWTTNNKWADYVGWVQSMINALVNSEDRGMIFGDILNAYGADKIFALNPISSDYQVQPSYDREVLTQIENLSLLGYAPGNVIQNMSTVSLEQQWPNFSPTTWTTQQAVVSTQVLNFHQATAPTQEQIMIATRLKLASNYSLSYTGSESPSFQMAPWTYGTEVVTDVQAFWYDWTSTVPGLASQSLISLFKTSASTISMGSMYIWATFDWAPWIYALKAEPSVPTTAYQKITVEPEWAIGDYDNYVYLSDVELQKMQFHIR